MKIVFVSSGSKGNATLIAHEEGLIQIDMGVPKKEVAQGLKILDRKLEDIQGVFITHEHSDRTGGLVTYHGKLPLYASEGTLPKEDISCVLNPGVGMDIAPFMVFPFSASHDANNPVNYVIYAGKEKLGYVTDTGLIYEDNLPLLKNCDYYLFESNHDYKMLLKSSRPLALKRRIHSEHGHLCNIDAAKYLCSLIGPNTKQIFLGHISDECNTTELALAALRKEMVEQGIDDSHIKITAIPQKTLQIGGELL